jgi:hypothetical protein
MTRLFFSLIYALTYGQDILCYTLNVIGRESNDIFHKASTLTALI